MHKLCYFIVLHFVIKIAIGEYDFPEIEELIPPPDLDDDNAPRHFGTLAESEMESNILAHLSILKNSIEELAKKNMKKIVESMNLLVNENEKMLNSMLAKANEKIVESMNLIVKENEKMLNNVLAKVNEKNFESNLLAKENKKLVDNINGLAKGNADTLIPSPNSLDALIKIPVNAINAYPQNDTKVTEIPDSSGIYDTEISNNGSEPFKVVYEKDLYGGGWIVFARRMDGSINFADRNWTEYKEGFGDSDEEFFIGMDKLYALTNGDNTQELIIVLGDFNGQQRYAKYSEFAIGDESEEYFIKALGNYSGDAGDSFTYHRDQTFKTKDRNKSCTYLGAWWYKNCQTSNLFGLYLKGDMEFSDYGKGVSWNSWLGDLYSLKFVQMMIRPNNS